ncbi:MAG: SDR family NAD(P)-dependent oxidoreductase, partial [Aquabacterium sp.]|nr:SDR family NAD(P)-dependent oxidoreductase [Aquabacterium sp.]
MTVTHRTALITGGASGIGRATVQIFAEAGARVLLADIDQTRGEQAVAELRAQGHSAEFVA